MNEWPRSGSRTSVASDSVDLLARPTSGRSRSLGPRIASEVVIEGPVLFDDEDDVLDRKIRLDTVRGRPWNRLGRLFGATGLQTRWASAWSSNRRALEPNRAASMIVRTRTVRLLRAIIRRRAALLRAASHLRRTTSGGNDTGEPFRGNEPYGRTHKAAGARGLLLGAHHVQW